MNNEFDADGVMRWERVTPPIKWKAADAVIVADRHLPDGTRQHLVRGRVPPGRIVNNAHVIGEDDVPVAEFSSESSHLSD